MAIRVLIVEDYPVTREGLGAVLSQEPDMEVVGFAEDGETAIAAISKLKPDVVWNIEKNGRRRGRQRW